MGASRMPSLQHPHQPSGIPPGDSVALRLELAVDAASIGGFDWNLRTDEVVWDDRMKALLGVDADDQPTLERFARRVIPADRPALEEAAIQAIASGGDLRIDFRVIDEAGATRWLTVRGRVLLDERGRGARMLGMVYDSSSVHTDREQAARALDTMATAYATVDTNWTVRYANQAARVLIAGRGEPVGSRVWDLVPQLANPSIAGLLRNVMAGQDSANAVLRAPRLGGWLEVSVQPVANGIAVLVNNVTARREAENEAEQAAARVALLAQAGTVLVQRRPVVETVEAGLAVLVPQLAMAAMIYLRDGEDHRLKLVSLRHQDPDAEFDLRQVYGRLPLGDDPTTATGRAVATGRTQVIGDLDETVVNRAVSDPDARQRLIGMRAVGVLAVPLVSRGESIGFIGLMGLGGKTPSGPDLVLIEDIASRIASAIDNAQIFGQVQQARQTAELVTARLEFLASVADALGSTLDADQASARLARMVVPTLGDWAMVTLLDDEGRVESIVGSHSDASKQALLEEYTARRFESLTVDSSILKEVVTGGTPTFQLSGESFSGRLAEDPAAAALAALAPGAVTAFPILARDRSLGVISFYNSIDRGFPTDMEMDSAREVARRAGLVLDNARLYARSQSMAETLQRSLLTKAVEPADLQVATRYVPAIADAQVGGDWYDAFQTGDGLTTLVIGDVMGHDKDAAALMGQLRTLVRAIAVDRQEPPGAVLSRVDAAAHALGVDTTATAVLGQVLESTSTPGGRLLRWSNAGHPPPVLIDPDGTVRVLESPPDLLLGLRTGLPRADHEVELPYGSTVLMFTDGLVEGRAQPLDIGLLRLAQALGPLTKLPLEQMCDELLKALLPPQGAEDDVALVAVRVEHCPAGGSPPTPGEEPS